MGDGFAKIEKLWMKTKARFKNIFDQEQDKNIYKGQIKFYGAAENPTFGIIVRASDNYDAFMTNTQWQEMETETSDPARRLLLNTP